MPQLYARYKWESAYPELWPDYGWCPSIQPYGITTLYDMGGNCNHGTLTNFTAGSNLAAAWATPLTFDNSDDYVSVPDQPSLSLIPFTISAWIKIPNYASYYIIAAKGVGNGATSNNFELRTASSSGVLQLVGNQSGAAVTSSAAIPQNTWTHVMGTFDGTTSRLYINGQPDGSSSGITFNTNTANMRIGGRNDGLKFNGAIDGVMLHGRALSASEAPKLWSLGPAGIYTPRQQTILSSQTGNRRRRVIIGAA